MFKKNKVTYIKGFGSFKDKNTISVKDDSGNQKDYKFKNAIIATGSVPISLPNIEIDENAKYLFLYRKNLLEQLKALKRPLLPKQVTP